jgi:golgi apparatus protein 1
MKLLRRYLLLLLVAAAHPLFLHPICADGTQSEPADSHPDAPAEKHAPADGVNSDDDQIEEAPHVDELPGGVGDLEVHGPCAADIETFCGSVKPGGSHLAECIQNQIMDEEQSAVEFTAQVTEQCKDDLLNYKMKLVSNINLDKERRKACKKDAHKLCGEKVLDGDAVPGEVIACLTEARPALSKVCAESIYEAQLEAAQDYRLNAILYAECKDDASRVCAHVEPGNGRVNACLRDKRSEV